VPNAASKSNPQSFFALLVWICCDFDYCYSNKQLSTSLYTFYRYWPLNTLIIEAVYLQVFSLQSSGYYCSLRLPISFLATEPFFPSCLTLAELHANSPETRAKRRRREEADKESESHHFSSLSIRDPFLLVLRSPHCLSLGFNFTGAAHHSVYLCLRLQSTPFLHAFTGPQLQLHASKQARQ